MMTTPPVTLKSLGKLINDLQHNDLMRRVAKMKASEYVGADGKTYCRLVRKLPRFTIQPKAA